MLSCLDNQCPDCIIHRFPLFRGLDRQIQHDLLSALFPSRFVKKHILAMEGKPADEFFFVKQGVIKAYKCLHKEKCQIVRIYRNGDLMPPGDLFDRFYGETLETLTAAVTCTIARHDFEALINKNSSLAVDIIGVLTRELSEANRTIRDMGLKNARAKVAAFILSFVQPQGLETEQAFVELSVSRSDAANILGITQETISRVLRELKSSRIISIQNKRICIENRSRLQKISEK